MLGDGDLDSIFAVEAHNFVLQRDRFGVSSCPWNIPKFAERKGAQPEIAIYSLRHAHSMNLLLRHDLLSSQHPTATGHADCTAQHPRGS